MVSAILRFFFVKILFHRDLWKYKQKGPSVSLDYLITGAPGLRKVRGQGPEEGGWRKVAPGDAEQGFAMVSQEALFIIPLPSPRAHLRKNPLFHDGIRITNHGG